MRYILPFCATLLAAPAMAQTAFPCDGQSHAVHIVEPWEDNSATFSNGAVRVAVLDTIEPAAAASYLMVLHPPYDEVGERRCTLVGWDDGLGYAGMYFQDVESDYDPAVGLILTVPAQIYLPEQSFLNTALLTITVNQASGNVSVTQKLGG